MRMLQPVLLITRELCKWGAVLWIEDEGGREMESVCRKEGFSYNHTATGNEGGRRWTECSRFVSSLSLSPSLSLSLSLSLPHERSRVSGSNHVSTGTGSTHIFCDVPFRCVLGYSKPTYVTQCVCMWWSAVGRWERGRGSVLLLLRSSTNPILDFHAHPHTLTWRGHFLP